MRLFHEKGKFQLKNGLLLITLLRWGRKTKWVT